MIKIKNILRTFIAAALLLPCLAQAPAQVTVTTSNTVKLSNATRPWIDMADPVEYGNGQIYKSLFYADGGTFPQIYNQNSWSCNVGGTGGTPTTTSWPNQATGASGTASSYSVTSNVVTITGTFSGLAAGNKVQFSGFTSATFLNGQSVYLSTASSTVLTFPFPATTVGTTSDTGGIYLGYPTNYFVGASFIARSSTTGTTYGSGTISASTATTSTNGPVFTLSPAISTACSNGDVIEVLLRTPTQQMTPYQLFSQTGASICQNATFNTSDVAPTSSNQLQSLELPSGCTLTLYADQTTNNSTNPNPTLAAESVNYINVNGSYTQSLKYKCGASSGTGSMSFSVVRANGGQTFVSSTPLSPACTATNGSGWATVTNSVTGTETGTQQGNLVYQIVCTTGPCLLNDANFVEGSTLTGNTTPFRDDVVRTITGQTGYVTGLKPGGIRWMSPAQWCTDEADQTNTTYKGNIRWCNVSNYIPFSLQPTIGYDDELSLCDFAGISCALSIGQFNQSSDWTALITWLSTNTHYINIVAAGNKVFLEHGNEAFNSDAGGSLYQGDGILYGAIIGPDNAASKAASGYSSTGMKLVANSWFAPNQSFGAFGWAYEVLTYAGHTTNGLPDYMEIAPYNFAVLNNCSTAGTSCDSSGLTTSGEPWTGMFAEINTFDTVATAPSGSSSVIESCQYVLTTFSVPCMIYEMNSGLIYGLASTQTQLDSVAAGVGEGLAMATHWGLMQSTAGVTGPLGNFQLAERFNGFNCSGSGCISGNVSPVWGFMATMPCGPGQLTACAPQFRPQGIALQVYNNSITTGSNMMAATLSGQPTYSYAGGQPNSGTNSIEANSSVAEVYCFTWNLSSNWTVICNNLDQTSSHTVTIAGPGAPTGSVNQTIFGGPANLITDHNEASYIATLGTAPVVTTPSSSSTSGTTYTIQPASMVALTYTVGASSSSSMTITGNVTMTGSVTNN